MRAKDHMQNRASAKARAVTGRHLPKGRQPRFGYVALVDGREIMGMFFKTRAEAIAFAERVAAITPKEEEPA